MATALRCPCGQAYQAPPRLAGRLVRCRKCGTPLRIPSPQPPSSDPDPLGDLASFADFDEGAFLPPGPPPKKAPRKPVVPPWFPIRGVIVAVAIVLVGGLSIWGIGRVWRTISRRVAVAQGVEPIRWSAAPDPAPTPLGPPRAGEAIDALHSPNRSVGPASRAVRHSDKYRVRRREKDYPVGTPGAEQISTYTISSVPRQEVVIETTIPQQDDALVRFLPNDRLLIFANKWLREYFPDGDGYHESTVGRGIVQLWDLTTGKLLIRFETERIQAESADVSPGGRLLAGATEERIFLYDTQTGKLVGETKWPELKGYKRWQSALDKVNTFETYSTPCKRLRFSHDGAKLAGLFDNATENKIFCWNLEDGRLVASHAIPGPPLLCAYFEQSSFRWLWDDRAWLCYRSRLIGCSDGRTLWLYADRRGRPAGTARLKRLRDKQPKHRPIDYAAVREAIKAMQAGNPAWLRPGGDIDLKVEIGTLQHGSESATRKFLRDAIGQRIDRAGIGLASRAPIVLRAFYTESPGEILELMEGANGFPAWLSGKPTGKTVGATKALLKLAWETRDGKTTFASFVIEMDPTSLYIRGGGNLAANARDAMLEDLPRELSDYPMLYFIPKDKNTAILPSVTSPEPEDDHAE